MISDRLFGLVTVPHRTIAQDKGPDRSRYKGATKAAPSNDFKQLPSPKRFQPLRLDPLSKTMKRGANKCLSRLLAWLS
jgi:hypothetical protein